MERWKRGLEIFSKKIAQYIQEKLLCSLKIPLLNTCTRGLPFCGYVLRPYFIRLSKQSKIRFIKKHRYLFEQLERGKISQKDFQKRSLAMVAFTEHADARVFRQSVFSGKEKGEHT